MSQVNVIKIGALPGEIKDYGFEGEITVAQALAANGLTASGFEVRVNGNVVKNLESKLNAASKTVYLTKMVKGNANEVKIGALPGEIKTEVYSDDVTIGQAIQRAGLTTTGFEVRVNGIVTTDFSQRVNPHTKTIYLTKMVKGNV